MRNTESGGKTPSTMSLSSRALSRSWPNGFSMTTRRQAPLSDRVSPQRSSCSHTVEKKPGGIER
jgi:hypothetical protein